MASREVLPPNIDNDGRIVGGMFRQKNIIEAGIAVFLIFIFQKIFLFAVPSLIKYVIILAIGLPSVLICVIGIGDLSVSEWFMDRKSFKKSKNIYPFRIPTKKTEKKSIFFKKKKEKK